MAGRDALKIVQKFFPGVTSVVDAVRPQVIEVQAKDGTVKGVKNHEECALAVACKRSMKLDGVIISRSVAYLVKGKKARRFNLPPGTAREVVSFDRGAGFQPGKYLLSGIEENRRLGHRQGSNKDKATGNGKPKPFRHVTSNIRTVLGGVDPD